MRLVQPFRLIVVAGFALLAGLMAGGPGYADELPSFSPKTYDLTVRAISAYEEIADAGGWKPLPDIAIGLKLGSTGKLAVALRQRLAVTLDLDPTLPPSKLFDETARQALQHFQARHGLTQTGVVGKLTLAALNVPVEDRLRQLDATLTRMASGSFPFGDRYVVVNLPAASLEAVENGVVNRIYTTVVGRPDRPSPTLQTRIVAANILPYWNVPPALVRVDIMPKQLKDPHFLETSHMKVLGPKGNEIDPTTIDWTGKSGVDFNIRQEPGVDNSLGFVRIDMPNPYAVYMHDTPHRENFRQDVRFQSSGCTRVAGAQDLVAWLLAGTEWTGAAIQDRIDSGEPKTVRLSKPVPVAWVYFTAWGAADGTIQFRPDIYSLDNPMGILLSTIGPPFSIDKTAAKPVKTAAKAPAKPDPATTGSIRLAKKQ